MLLDINAITVHRQIVLTNSTFDSSTNACGTIITILIGGRRDRGKFGDLSEV